MTFQELQERCKNRNFDQIVIVVKDIFEELSNMQRIMDVLPGDIRVCTNETDPGLKTKEGEIAYVERQATFFYENTQICVIQPVEGETVYKQYLDRYGSCICCARERIAPEEYQKTIDKLSGMDLTIAQKIESEDCKAAWVDLTKELGILYEIISDDSKKLEVSNVIPARIAQINVTTPNVRETVQTIAELLEIGPWEVGRQNNATATKTGFWTDGELKDIEFEYLLAILVCGNIEWEAIEPIKGHLVFNDFLDRRGIGFHHLLMEIPQGQWEQKKATYAKKGINMTCKGSIGPIDWCYMDTEKELGFYTELRTDAVMTQLPDGYLAYFYPEQQ